MAKEVLKVTEARLDTAKVFLTLEPIVDGFQFVMECDGEFYNLFVNHEEAKQIADFITNKNKGFVIDPFNSGLMKR